MKRRAVEHHPVSFIDGQPVVTCKCGFRADVRSWVGVVPHRLAHAHLAHPHAPAADLLPELRTPSRPELVSNADRDAASMSAPSAKSADVPARAEPSPSPVLVHSPPPAAPGTDLRNDVEAVTVP